MTMVGNVLSAESLSKVMASSLPQGQDSSPKLKTPYDAIALASHSCMLAVGFRLVGLSDDDRLEASSTPSPRLPAQWNATSPNYAFRYAHAQSSMEYLLKVNRMANKAVVMAMALGDDKTATFDLKLADYVSESSLPLSAQTPESTDLVDVFISSSRLSDFGSLVRINVVQKLMPALQKEGYQESAPTTTPQPATAPAPPRHDPLREDHQPPARPRPFHDPLQQPRPPFPQGDFAPPGFEDSYDMNRPLRPLTGPQPGFGHIGERDLYPPGLGPRGGFAPGFGPAPGGGGMYPTPSELFGGRSGSDYDPQAPPGSRYDIVGPGDPRGPQGPGPFPGGRSGMGGRPPNPFGGFGGGDFI